MNQIQYILLTATLFLFASCAGKSATHQCHSTQNRDKIEVSQTVSVMESMNYKPDEILVRFKPNIETERIKDVIREKNLSILHQFEFPNLYLLKINDGKEVVGKIQELSRLKEVAYAEPNYRVNIDSTKEKQPYQHGEILIRFKNDANKNRIEAILKENGLELNKAYSLPNLFLVKILGDATVKETVNRLCAYSEVLYAEPNYTIFLNPMNQ